MRLRDKLFPEGTILRKILRAMAHIAKGFKPHNLKTVFNMLKEQGLIKTIKEVNGIVFGKVEYEDMNKIYQEWIKYNEPTKREIEEQRKHKFENNPKISILVPMYNTPYKFFKELVECLINQTYPNWELCLADGSPEQDKSLEEIYKMDERIKYKFIGENKGIAGNTNECIKLATGDFIALFDHDDLLPIFSLYEVVKCINENPEVEFIYTDEDKITTLDKPRFNPHFKPDFSLDFLRANNYICHFSVFKKELMDKLEGERSKYDGAQDFDIILRVAENVKDYKNIIHIPKVLYHWRVHANSTAQAETQAKPYAFEAGIPAIQDHLERIGLKGTVEHGASLGTYRIKYEFEGNPKVSIIIPNKDEKETLKTCIDSILEKTTYENYEIVIDEQVSKPQDVYNLGIEVGDIVSFDTRTKITKSGFIKSRYLDDKASVSAILHVIKYIKLNDIKPKYDINFLFSNYEEVGHGASSFIPDNTVEFIAVDMGCPGENQNSSEYDVCICTKDSNGPYDYELINKLVDVCKENNINYKLDIYPNYGSDATAALKAGMDAKFALIGPGIFASHGYERTHISSIIETEKLIISYIK